MLGATVCRRHGGSAPQVRRNAEKLAAIWEFRAALPFLQSWVDSLASDQARYVTQFAYADQPRRCRAHRKDGQPCRAWAIRGGYVCRKHGGAAPQVRAKAEQRLLAAKLHRQLQRKRRADM